ncbi:MAG: hypothetical protein FWF46_00230 [Oscillospiraceae bacterium]|nr:hypothetical protein [Oscillospiraceae bacterium]
MAIISFWNREKVESGKTLSMAAIGTYMAIHNNYKVLMISTQFNDTTLSDCFIEPNKEDITSEITANKPEIDTGIEGLSRAVLSNKSTPDIITNYTKVIFRDRLEILLSPKTTNYDEYAKIASAYKDIVQFANKHYDIVLVDLENGMESQSLNQVISVSNLLVYHFSQKQKMIDQIGKLKKENPESFNSLLLCMGRYDLSSKYSTKNVARALGTKREIIAVPYNMLYAEAAGEGKVADYFIKYNGKLSDPTDRNTIFIQGVMSAIEIINYRLQEIQQYK